MKKLLTLLFALITLFSFGQDAAPDTLAVRLNSPSFYYSPGDSSLRMYKCYVYGWTKLAPQRNVDNLAAWAGTVKSVGITVPTGLSVTGSPVTVSGTIGIGLASGYSIPSTSDQTNWTSKEPAIATGSTLQFWRGDKTWQALNPANVGLSNVSNNAQWYSGYHPTTLVGYGITDTPWTGMGYLISGGALGTPSSGTLTNCTFPTLNQSTTGSAATLTTARTIAGTSFNGSANIALANKFIVQGTSDAGLSGPQFLGALATGVVKNTTTTGVLSIATGADLPAMSSTVGGAVPTPPNDATKFLSGAGTFLAPSGTVSSVSVISANGVSGTVATPTTTPAISLTLGAITPSSTNGVTAATMAFMDATSSVQTQLNNKVISGGALGTPSSGALTNCTFPTLNQSTTGSAATLTTARTIAGTSFNGSANIALSNKFIVQGTTDAGLSGPQFLGALGTGILKNTTTTGVLSIATGADLPAMSATVGGAVPTPPNDATKFLSGAGTFLTPSSGLTGTGTLGYIPYWSTATNLIKSPLFSDGTNTGFGTSTLSHQVEILGTTDYPVQVKGSSGGGWIIGDGVFSAPAGSMLWPSLGISGAAIVPGGTNYTLGVWPAGMVNLNIPTTGYGINMTIGGTNMLGMTENGALYLGSTYAAGGINATLPAGSFVMSGNHGIGLGIIGTAGTTPVVPTARMHIVGGTAAAGTAPLKLNSGTLMTTPEAGAIENDGANLYYTTTGTVNRMRLNKPTNHSQYTLTGPVTGVGAVNSLTSNVMMTFLEAHALIMLSANLAVTSSQAFTINITVNGTTVQTTSGTIAAGSQQISFQVYTAVTTGSSIPIAATWNATSAVTAKSISLTTIELP